MLFPCFEEKKFNSKNKKNSNNAEIASGPKLYQKILGASFLGHIFRQVITVFLNLFFIPGTLFWVWIDP